MTTRGAHTSIRVSDQIRKRSKAPRQTINEAPALDRRVALLAGRGRTAVIAVANATPNLYLSATSGFHRAYPRFVGSVPEAPVGRPAEVLQDPDTCQGEPVSCAYA
jgi:hypothetical protein